MKYKKEKIKGFANTVSGKMKETAGKLTDNPKLKIKGGAQQLKGKAQMTSADVKESARKSLR